MAERLPDAWQFSNVSIIGKETQSIQGLYEVGPLRVSRENLPVGSNAGSAAFPLTVTGRYLRVAWTLPQDLVGIFEWSGELVIRRKTREFCRDFTDTSADTLFSMTYDIGAVTRGEYFDDLALLDQDVGEVGTVWYYTVFVKNSLTGLWAYSPAFSIARDFVISNEVGSDGQAVSRHGSRLFLDQPRKVRRLDETDGSGALKRLLEVFGRVFDGIKDAADQSLSAYDVDQVDAGKLPFIDWLLAWPTNFEFPELARRIETSNIVTLWKSKGSKEALELALQTITRWNVTVHEGWKWVLTTAIPGELLDAAAPPADWNGATDGVWADLVNALPKNTLFDPTVPMAAGMKGTLEDRLCRTPDLQRKYPTGVGFWWQNPNGVLLELEEVPGVSVELSNVLIQKVLRIAPMFATYYAAFIIFLIPVTSEEAVQLFGSDGFDDAADISTDEAVLLFEAAAITETTSPDIAYLMTYPQPGLLSDPTYRMYHNDIEFTG